MAHYEHTYVVPGEAGPAPGGHDRPGRPRRLVVPARRSRAATSRTVGEIFSADDQPRPQEGLRHPHGDARGRRPGPRDARALGRHGRRRHRGRLGRPPRRLPGLPARASSRGRYAAPRLPAHRRTGHLHRRARCSRGRRRRRRGRSTRPAATGRWSCWRTCRASTGHRTRCATCSSSTAPRSAARSSTSDGPIVFCVISRYHGGAFVVFSKALNPQHDGAGRRGLVRLGDRRRARRGGGVHRRGRQAHRRRAPASRELEARIAEADGRGARPAAWSSWPSCAPRSRAEKISEVAAEFDGIHNIHRAVEVGSVDAVIPAARLRPEIIAVIERSLGRRTARTE